MIIYKIFPTDTICVADPERFDSDPTFNDDEDPDSNFTYSS